MRTEPFLAMPADGIGKRPEVILRGSDQFTTSVGEQMTGQVICRWQLGRDFDKVAIGKGNKPFVECPMAKMAQSQAVARVVVVAFAQGNDMGGSYGGMPVDGEDTHAAQGAAVIVGFDDGAAETLVAYRFGDVCFSYHFLWGACLSQ